MDFNIVCLLLCSDCSGNCSLPPLSPLTWNWLCGAATERVTNTDQVTDLTADKARTAEYGADQLPDMASN